MNGFEIYRIILKDLARLAIILIIMIFVTNKIFDYYRVNFDDSDNNVTGERSGLKTYTDYKTMVRYVGTPNGSLFVRIDRDGKIITKK